MADRPDLMSLHYGAMQSAYDKIMGAMREVENLASGPAVPLSSDPDKIVGGKMPKAERLSRYRTLRDDPVMAQQFLDEFHEQRKMPPGMVDAGLVRDLIEMAKLDEEDADG